MQQGSEPTAASCPQPPCAGTAGPLLRHLCCLPNRSGWRNGMVALKQRAGGAISSESNLAVLVLEKEAAAPCRAGATRAVAFAGKRRAAVAACVPSRLAGMEEGFLPTHSSGATKQVPSGELLTPGPGVVLGRCLVFLGSLCLSPGFEHPLPHLRHGPLRFAWALMRGIRPET